MWKITILLKHIFYKWSLNEGDKIFKKLWDHLQRREKLDLRWTKLCTQSRRILNTYFHIIYILVINKLFVLKLKLRNSCWSQSLSSTFLSRLNNSYSIIETRPVVIAVKTTRQTGCPPMVAEINEKFIISKEIINVVGATFDSKLRWTEQVANASSKALKALNAIKLIRRNFTKNELLH